MSNQFDDTYYSKSDGQAETRHVYLNGNNLPERWKSAASLSIGELGFGTGLNFLETVSLWKLNGNPNGHLNYISYEQYPLTKADITKALSQWSSLKDLGGQLVAIWEPSAGTFQIEFSQHISLTIVFGDANDELPKQTTMIDAWYLDGFSPAKNPELWNLELMQQVYDHTNNGGTFATYSVAGYVRRNLQQAGFSINRQKGFGSKREMLVGIRN